MSPDDFEAAKKVVEEVAGILHRFDREWSDLCQEGWMFAIPAVDAYYRKFPNPEQRSVSGLRGWVYRTVYVRVAMYVRRKNAPVSVPKKNVPADVRAGFGTVDVLDAPLPTGDLRTETFRAEARRQIRDKANRVFSRFPLARWTLVEEETPLRAARALGKPGLSREMARQRDAARAILAKELAPYEDDL